MTPEPGPPLHFGLVLRQAAEFEACRVHLQGYVAARLADVSPSRLADGHLDLFMNRDVLPALAAVRAAWGIPRGNLNRFAHQILGSMGFFPIWITGRNADGKKVGVRVHRGNLVAGQVVASPPPPPREGKSNSAPLRRIASEPHRAANQDQRRFSAEKVGAARGKTM